MSRSCVWVTVAVVRQLLHLRLNTFSRFCQCTNCIPQGHQPTEMPAWMSALHKKLTDGKTQNNIRLFITRLITNRPRVFQPYAKFWLAPLAQLVVAGHLGGKGMHYFLVDVMVTMLSWSTTAVLEVRCCVHLYRTEPCYAVLYCVCWCCSICTLSGANFLFSFFVQIFISRFIYKFPFHRF